MTIILYTRRNVGLCALSYFVAAGHMVKVVTDDVSIMNLAENLGVPVVDEDTMGEYDLICSVHWNKIIPEKYLVGKKSFNIHPVLFKYVGKDPIARYIKNKDTFASVESHVMIKEVDAGGLIYSEFFQTPVIENYASFYNQALKYYFKVFAETLKRI